MNYFQNRGGGLDMNVVPAWREGVTGQGVVVAILDDGLEMDHPDLLANYVSFLSFIYFGSVMRFMDEIGMVKNNSGFN